MVLPGQFLERPALIACGALTLEGLYHRGGRRPALLLCPPVAEAGMDAPALAELAWACARAGHASLRFQHRGCGASQGARDPAQALADAGAALDHLVETAPGSLAVAGLGSGCATALALARARPGLAAAIVIAPAALPAQACPVPALAILPEALALDAGALGRALGSAGGVEPRIEVVAGADALFRRGLPEVARLALAFLRRARAGTGP